MPLPVSVAEYEWSTAKQRVYETVKDWIIEKQLLPGEKISDTEIASYFNVSRTPVREALQMLEAQKLVKSFPGRATIVTELNTDNIEKWYAPMSVLQQLAMQTAIDKFTREQTNHLIRLAKEFEEAVKHQDEPMQIMDADKNFHSYILEVAENEYIQDFCDVLWIHIQRLEYDFFKATPMGPSVDEHAKIIRAIEMKDSFTASRLVKSHWDRTVITINEMNK